MVNSKRSGMTKRVRNEVLFCAVWGGLLAAAPAVYGETATWQGGVGLWNEVGRWSGVYPGNAAYETDVWVDGESLTPSHVSVNDNIGIRNLTITAGDTVAVPSPFSAGLGIRGALQLDGTLSVPDGGSGFVRLDRPGERVNGGGAIDFTGGWLTLRTDDTVFGSGITIRGSKGQFDTVVNEGRFVLDHPEAVWTFYSLNNSGLIELSNGAVLTTTGSPFLNTGTIRLADATLNLSGLGPLTDLGTIERSGNSVLRITGIVHNAGRTFTPSAATGDIVLSRSASIRDGRVELTGGARLLFDGDSGGSSSFAMFSNITVGGTLPVDGRLTISRALMLDEANVELSDGGILDFCGCANELIGSGEVALGMGGSLIIGGYFPLSGVRIGPDVTIHGAGSIQSQGTLSGTPGRRFTNAGTVTSNVAGQGIHFQGLLTNEATVQAVGGGHLSFSTEQTINSGLIQVSGGGNLTLGGLLNTATGRVEADGGQVTLDGNWENKGVIDVRNAPLFLGGTFSLAALGDLRRTNVPATNLIGRLKNQGATLAPDAASGPWIIKPSALVEGGTIVGNSLLSIEGGRFWGVTFQGSPRFIPGATAGFEHPLILDDVVIDAPEGPSPLTFSFLGNVEMGGAATINVGEAGLRVLADRLLFSGTHLTIGSGITIRGKNATIELAPQTYPYSGSITNKGTLIADVADGHFLLSSVRNDGFVSASNGSTLTLNGNWSNSGTINLADATINLGGRFTRPGMGTINRSGAVTTNFTGILDNTGATLALEPAATGVWNMRGGTIYGGAVSAAPGHLRVFDGMLAGVDLIDVPDLQPGFVLKIAQGLTLHNGTIDLSAGGAQGGTLEFAASPIGSNPSELVLGGTGTILFGASGNDRMNHSISTNVILSPGIAIGGLRGVMNGAYTNQGLIRIGEGSGGSPGGLTFNAFIHNQSRMEFLEGASLHHTSSSFRNDGVLEVSGDLSLNGLQNNATGRITATGSKLTIGGTWFNDGVIDAGAAAVMLGGRFSGNRVGDLRTTGGVKVSGTVDSGTLLTGTSATGPWTLDGATVLNSTVAAAGSPGALTLVAATFEASKLLASPHFVSGAQLSIKQTLTLGPDTHLDLSTAGPDSDGVTLRLLSGRFNSGATVGSSGGTALITLGAGGKDRIINDATAAATFGSGVRIEGSAGTIGGGAGPILIQGELISNGGGTLKLINVHAAGTVTAMPDSTLEMTTYSHQLSTAVTNVNGTLVSGENLSLLRGTLSGTGRVSVPLLNLAGANLSPGSGGGSIGAIDIDADVTWNGAGRLSVQLDTDTSDLARLDGTASLAGTLVLSKVPGAAYSVGEVYQILTAESVTGRFGRTTGTDVGGGLAFVPLYLPSEVRVRVSLAGDADLDDQVSYMDFLILKENYASPGKTHAQGDFNGDGIVSLTDFTIIESNFGRLADGTFVAPTAEESEALAAFAASVPEPSGLLWLLGACFLGSRGRRGCSGARRVPAGRASA